MPIFTSNGFARASWHLGWIFEKKEEEEEINFIEYNCLFLLMSKKITQDYQDYYEKRGGGGWGRGESERFGQGLQWLLRQVAPKVVPG